MYERMNVCDALTSTQFSDGERIINQVNNWHHEHFLLYPDPGGHIYLCKQVLSFYFASLAGTAFIYFQ